MKKLTHEEFKKVAHYDPETGIFVYAKDVVHPTTNRIYSRKGDIMGSLSKIGYWSINTLGIIANRSRCAFFYMEGFWPVGYYVDHINRIKHDDRWSNLRLVTNQCNMRNCNLKQANKSGITGVFWFKRDKKWTAQISVDYKAKYLGYFDTKIDAAKARWKAEKENNFPDCNTYSSAYLYLKQEGAI